MARLHEIIETSLPTDEAYAFVANFANAQHWDPGVAWSRSLTAGPPRVGSAYELGVRMGRGVTSMEYRVTQIQPNERVVLSGSGANVSAVDDIRFEPSVKGTRIEYTADIQLTGWLRLAAPFAGRAFAAIARNARDGMQRTLDGMSAASHRDTDAERAA
jgi:carbon monoxide dehydrogenase subunit G